MTNIYKNNIISSQIIRIKKNILVTLIYIYYIIKYRTNTVIFS